MRHFLTSFTEDVGLLPAKLCERNLDQWSTEPEPFSRGPEQLEDQGSAGLRRLEHKGRFFEVRTA